MRKLSLALAAVAALSIAASAHSAIVVHDYTVTGSGTGSFTLNLDTATSTYTLTALNLTLGDTSFATADAVLADLGSGSLVLGGAAGGGAQAVLVAGTSDFWFPFADIGLFSGQVLFTQNNGQSQSSGTLTIFLTPESGVPEPASWAMMLLGFGAIGAAMRRRKLALA